MFRSALATSLKYESWLRLNQDSATQKGGCVFSRGYRLLGLKRTSHWNTREDGLAMLVFSTLSPLVHVWKREFAR